MRYLLETRTTAKLLVERSSASTPSQVYITFRRRPSLIQYACARERLVAINRFRGSSCIEDNRQDFIHQIRRWPPSDHGRRGPPPSGSRFGAPFGCVWQTNDGRMAAESAGCLQAVQSRVRRTGGLGFLAERRRRCIGNFGVYIYR